MREIFGLFVKGVAMGAANVIPGVSGGTIAFITGIYERLINAIKSFDGTAVKLGLRFKLKELWAHVDAAFLAPLGLGVIVSIVSLAKLLEWLFERHEVVVWAFFFGLILASIPYVFRAVKQWGASTWLSLLLGVLVAGGIAFLPRAGANESVWYVLVCGMAAVSSMIIPGVSGSFVLLLMGNYFLVLGAISGLDFKILLPFGVGCVVGIVGLSHLLSWVFKRHHDVAVALITGFIAGSLLVIWPWKDTKFDRDGDGALLVKTAERSIEARPGGLEEVQAGLGEGEELVVAGYENWTVPGFGERQTWMAFGALAVGVVLVVLMERAGSKKPASVE